MANDKFYGYNPNPANEKKGNRLDRVNPYEFKKGMDYELMEIGCNRLAESTPEERMNSTEKVLKNLTEHGGYYSALIHYETAFRNDSNKPTFKSWLSNYQEETMMKPVSEKDRLKEAIKKEIKKSLTEKKSFPDLTGDGEVTYADILKGRGVELDEDEDIDLDGDDEKAAKAAKKAGSKKGKGIKGLDKEAADLEKEKEGLKAKILPFVQAFNNKKKGKKPYSKSDYEADLKKIKTSDKSSVYSGSGKDHVTDRLKAINKRLEDIEKEKEEILLKEKMDRRAVAQTVMDRAVHKGLLNIIKEYGISLYEGSEVIKPYYEIAKIAYMEGLTAGLRSDDTKM